MATHSSTLAWQIPWTEEPGRLQSMGSLGVTHVCVHDFFICLSIKEHLNCFHILAIVNKLQCPWGCIYLFKLVFSFTVDKYPQMGLLDPMVVLFLIF